VIAPGKVDILDALMHPRDAANVLGMSVSWLAKSRLTGDGPEFVKVGRSVRYRRSSIQEYIRRRNRTSTSDQ
jgi:predicted DNA-binding transcriptional regulator AlpA